MKSREQKGLHIKITKLNGRCIGNSIVTNDGKNSKASNKMFPLAGVAIGKRKNMNNIKVAGARNDNNSLPSLNNTSYVHKKRKRY